MHKTPFCRIAKEFEKFCIKELGKIQLIILFFNDEAVNTSAPLHTYKKYWFDLKLILLVLQSLLLPQVPVGVLPGELLCVDGGGAGLEPGQPLTLLPTHTLI